MVPRRGRGRRRGLHRLPREPALAAVGGLVRRDPDGRGSRGADALDRQAGRRSRISSKVPSRGRSRSSRSRRRGGGRRARSPALSTNLPKAPSSGIASCPPRGPRSLCDGVVLRGLGYAEHLSMTIPPWRLPIDTLRWGRFLSPERSVVWIDWQKEGDGRTWIFVDGTEVRGEASRKKRFSLKGEESGSRSGPPAPARRPSLSPSKKSSSSSLVSLGALSRSTRRSGGRGAFSSARARRPSRAGRSTKS